MAVTERACDMVTWQVPVPEQPSPDQPVNVEPESGLALIVTFVPSLYTSASQVPEPRKLSGAVTVRPVPAVIAPTYQLAALRRARNTRLC